MFFGLKILSILAFSLLIIPTNASADIPGYVSAYGSGTYNNPIYQIAEVNNPKPIINSINPRSSNVGVGTKTITITGNGFVPSSVARINDSNRFTTFIDDSHLLVQSNNSDMSRVDGFYITVFNGAPGGGYSNAAFFTLNNTVATNTNTNNRNSSPDTYSGTTQTGNTTSNATSNDTTNNSYSGLASNAIFGSNSFLPSGLVQWVLFGIIVLLIIILVRKIFGARENYDSTPMKHA